MSSPYARSSTSRATSFTSTGCSAASPFSQQGAQAIDHRAGPLVVPDDVVERRPQLLDVDWTAFQKVPRRLRIAQDRRQRLTQLVRQCARQLSEHGHPAQMRQLASVGVGFQLRSLPIGDIPDDAENLVAVAADDARFVEALGFIGPERVFHFLGFVDARTCKRLLRARRLPAEEARP